MLEVVLGEGFFYVSFSGFGMVADEMIPGQTRAYMKNTLL